MPLILVDGTIHRPEKREPAKRVPYLVNGIIIPSLTIAELANPDTIYATPLFRVAGEGRPSYLPPLSEDHPDAA